MLKETVDAVSAFPAIITAEWLKESGWDLKCNGLDVDLKKDEVTLSFTRLPWGPHGEACTLDVKSVEWTKGEKCLRYVDNESPHIRALPDVGTWGGLDYVKDCSEKIAFMLDDISLEDDR